MEFLLGNMDNGQLLNFEDSTTQFNGRRENPLPHYFKRGDSLKAISDRISLIRKNETTTVEK